MGISGIQFGVLARVLHPFLLVCPECSTDHKPHKYDESSSSGAAAVKGARSLGQDP